MKYLYLFGFIACLLVLGVSLNQIYFVKSPLSVKAPDVFVGVDVAYADIDAIKKLVVELEDSTNLFIIGCTGITDNELKLDDVCQYLFDHEMYFIVYSERFPQARWIESAKNRWGDRFLGFYAFDEAGGRQLDQVRNIVWEAENITDASEKFVTRIEKRLTDFTQAYTHSVQPMLFTSDYALYWFDYKAGYDVLLGQFGWNLSRQLNVALCRGAATVQNKSWGVIVTWTYNHVPHIGSGEELYDDLVLAYDNGARYITIFDSNKPYTQGILQEEHIDAIERFWEYVEANPRTEQELDGRVGFVLPKDYAYGFRGPEDKIWGLWEADDFEYDISVKVGALLEEYGSKLDIIYDDGLDLDNTQVYDQLIFWNGTIQDG